MLLTKNRTYIVIIFAFLSLILLCNGCILGQQGNSELDETTIAALDYLRSEMDYYHTHTVVYDDKDSGGCRYIPSGFMKGESSKYNIDFAYSTDNPYSGTTCIRISWNPDNPSHWAGIYWQYPENNWGEFPGLNLKNAKKLWFWARGETGNEIAEFKFGGINGQQYEDSCKAISTGRISLTRDWKKYSINLTNYDTSNIIGGFCWVTNASDNPNGCTIYIDDIIIEHSRLNEPRLIRSYNITDIQLDATISQVRNTCYIYDNALAISAFLASNRPDDTKRAKILSDAFVLLESLEKDGRLRNAYSCGDLLTYDNKGNLIPRMPGKSIINIDGSSTWQMDSYANGTDTGNMAWAMLALLNMWESDGSKIDSPYLKTAKKIGNWILTNCSNSNKGFGFLGGIKWDGQKNEYINEKWQSTEHNIDLYAAFSRLAKIGDSNDKAKWQKAAQSAYEFVYWAYNEGKKNKMGLVTGTIEGEDKANLKVKPLDPQTWSVMAFPEDRNVFDESLTWANDNLRIDINNIYGYGFSDFSKTIWPEGTAQMASAYNCLGNTAKYTDIIHNLEIIQNSISKQKSIYGAILAAYPNEVDTGFGWNYYSFPHIGATSWFIMAKRKYNPFAGE